ncbi:MAG TPA: FkbM family methyltransferase [Vicinamibacterales bacterium]|nr:FkbM family methyltransferase [Vicinamibacterales bacterium]
MTFEMSQWLKNRLNLAKHRRSSVIKGLAVVSRSFERLCENVNYDPRYNGEERILRCLRPFEPRCVFDVGANRGDWALMCRRQLPGTTIHCFEIADETRLALTARIGHAPGFVINEFGLSNRSGTTAINYCRAQDEVTSEITYPHGLPTVAVEARVRRLDEYVAERGIRTIDFLKIDVEGAEPLVLEGAAGSLQSGVIDVIQFEYGLVNILTHFLLRDFYEQLSRVGYLIGKLYPSYVDFRPYRLVDEDFLGPNYLAVKRTRQDLILAMNQP